MSVPSDADVRGFPTCLIGVSRCQASSVVLNVEGIAESLSLCDTPTLD
jgi:hypothetical protein